MTRSGACRLGFEEEARAIGEEIEQAQQTRAGRSTTWPILVRASFQMREFEDRFVTLGLNYRVIGGPRFYERMEIRDAMAYFRWSCSPRTISPSSASSTRPSAASGEAARAKVSHDWPAPSGIP
jgi:DNA helicase-2/ATP-dependent DNA helicase PcrA